MTGGEKIAAGAAVAAPLAAAGVTLADVEQIAQIAAFCGSALAGLGAFVYYMVRTFRKEK